MQNSIYVGSVVHYRMLPTVHHFKYDVGMVLVDLDELTSAFNKIPLISSHRFNLLNFLRKSYLPKNLNISIKDAVKSELLKYGYNCKGKIYILTQPGYLGFCYNPVSFFYCYSEHGELEYFLAEVNNTPWNERRVYVHKCETENQKIVLQTEKDFHVSPFLPLDMRYMWEISALGHKINIQMKCYRNDVLLLQVNLHAQQKALTASNAWRLFIKNPFRTHLVLFRIYWQALFLYFKKTPIFTHPHKLAGA